MKIPATVPRILLFGVLFRKINLAGSNKPAFFLPGYGAKKHFLKSFQKF
jgi:hypothetical protein